jgi:hypothetical protein
VKAKILFVAMVGFRLGEVMQDILWILATIAFFAVGIAYVHFCERVK